LVCSVGSGVQLLDMHDTTISTFSTKEGLSDFIALSLFKDSKNRFWVSTEKGLNLLDFKKGTNTIFQISNGMPANGVYSILENKGRILAGTAKGLTTIDESEKTISGIKESSWRLQNYERSIGLPNLDFNANAAMITHSGQFWWGITPGVAILDEAALPKGSAQKPVQVTGLDILGKPQYFTEPEIIKGVDTIWNEVKDTFYLRNSFGETNTDKQKGIKWDSLSSTYIPMDLSLPYDRNNLRFHFGSFLPQNAVDYRYRYILDGVDKNWSSITDLPYSENYNNISPGYYSFRIAVRNGGGTWSEPSVYRFRIRPPWWLSWWAELIYLFVFAAALRFWVRYRSRRLLRENARLEQKVNQRTAELSQSLENLKQAQRQLVQSEKMASLGELTAGIAHEIQNPLNFVNNFSEVNTELLEDVNKTLDEGNISEAKEILHDVNSNMSKITFHGKRADAIVKGMLLHSRASNGQKVATDINALTDEYIRLSYHGLRAKDKSFNAKYSMNFDENIGKVMLVQQNIGRVLLNLFNNAFYSVTEKKKQIPEGFEPTVTVTTKRKNDSIEIRILDNGQGISQKVIDKIYQPFFTTKPAGQGTGLGLSLSYDIITKEHGGKIDVDTKENEFTEFIIELPAETAA
jgi:signal transduction histidine kinase